MLMTSMLMALALASVGSSGPSPVQGDFDHDGTMDVAEIIKEGGRYELVIRSGARHHRTFVVDRFEENDLANLYLTKKDPGRWQTWCGKGGDIGDGPCVLKSILVRNDTLAFGTEESSEAVAIWTGTGFQVVWLSD